MTVQTAISNKFQIWTDGGARGNPGPAGIGFVIKDEGQNLIYEEGKCIGTGTNNIAEYTAVVEALKYIVSNYNSFSAVFHLDSELVTKQLNGEYKVKDEKLKVLYLTVKKLIFESNGAVEFCHIRREQNKRADELYNLALDKS